MLEGAAARVPAAQRGPRPVSPPPRLLPVLTSSDRERLPCRLSTSYQYVCQKLLFLPRSTLLWPLHFEYLEYLSTSTEAVLPVFVPATGSPCGPVSGGSVPGSLRSHRKEDMFAVTRPGFEVWFQSFVQVTEVSVKPFSEASRRPRLKRKKFQREFQMERRILEKLCGSRLHYPPSLSAVRRT